ncbi:hypothetical protein OAI58_09175 [Amylibacter sp.]|nr:hypothetical protein [Amylibacter sp.]
MEYLFDIDTIQFNDFTYYVNNPTGVGPNIGYRYLIAALNITDLHQWMPILLAFSLNIIVDISWISISKKYLSMRALVLFIILIAIQPYGNLYTIKFSTIIFAKIFIVYYFYHYLYKENEQIKITWLQFFIMNIFALLRNSNALILIPFLIFSNLKLKMSLIFSGILMLTIVHIYLSGDYVDGLSPFNKPWDFNYVQTLLDSSSTVYTVIVLILSRIFILFGAREAIHNLGIEPFLTSSLSLIEIFFYLFLALINIVGFCYACYTFRSKFKFLFMLIIPLFLATFTVFHARYFLPYLPLSLLGIALLYDTIKNKKN